MTIYIYIYIYTYFYLCRNNQWCILSFWVPGSICCHPKVLNVKPCLWAYVRSFKPTSKSSPSRPCGNHNCPALYRLWQLIRICRSSFPGKRTPTHVFVCTGLFHGATVHAHLFNKFRQQTWNDSVNWEAFLQMLQSKIHAPCSPNGGLFEVITFQGRNGGFCMIARGGCTIFQFRYIVLHWYVYDSGTYSFKMTFFPVYSDTLKLRMRF